MGFFGGLIELKSLLVLYLNFLVELMLKKEIGVLWFFEEYFDYDGRGVKIVIFGMFWYIVLCFKDNKRYNIVICLKYSYLLKVLLLMYYMLKYYVLMV